MQVENALLLEVETYVSDFISNQIPKEHTYHDLQHTVNVVAACMEIGEGYAVAEDQMQLLLLAAWFHDTGYDKGAKDHEIRSAKKMREFLAKENFTEDQLQIIEGCILATKVPQTPKTLLQKIICDADLSHLGKKIYWDRCGRVRHEMTLTQNKVMGDLDWIEFEISFLEDHQYHTEVAAEFYNKRKKKHIRRLNNQKARLIPMQLTSIQDVPAKNKQKKNGSKKFPDSDDLELKKISLGRGVETMYRTTYRTHVNLSSIADNKANIMLSINAIIVSITISTLVPNFKTNPQLIFPTILLLVVCLIAIIFATLSTRPKITEGKFTREDIEQKKSNLLFFGNFYNMDIDDFHWGMMEMIKDVDFLYSSMTRDLYYLGVVLAKKYKYLRICYGVFMYGLIAAVVAFAIVFLQK